jgi:hypothetical protein
MPLLPVPAGLDLPLCGYAQRFQRSPRELDLSDQEAGDGIRAASDAVFAGF